MVACDVGGGQGKKEKEKREVYLYWISNVNCILIKTWCYTMWYGVDLINYFIKVLNTTLRKKNDPKKNCGNLINYYVNKIIEMLYLKRCWLWITKG